MKFFILMSERLLSDDNKNTEEKYFDITFKF